MRVSRRVRPYLRDLYNRRLAQGPEPYRPRSAWSNWNYNSELFAFQNRIGEQLDEETIRLVFIDRSYVNFISAQTTTPPGSDSQLYQQGNAALREIGFSVSQSYLMAFLRASYPRLPEEYIICITEHLMSPLQLASVAGHLGVKDIVLYASPNNQASQSGTQPIISEPPSLDVMATALLALIGSIAQQKSLGRAHLFVRDFILAWLVDMDLTGEIVTFDNPMLLLTGVLAAENRGLPESRLQRQCSMNTILACYQVGIYSDRELVGEAPGETIEIAEVEAARQALRNLFGLTEDRKPLNLCSDIEQFDCGDFAKPNKSINYYLKFASAPHVPALEHS